MPNAFDHMMGSVNGTTEIGSPFVEIGERTMAVPEVDQVAKYTEGKYTIQDRIDIGIGDNAVLAPGATVTYQTTVTTPFKPESFTIPSSFASDVSVVGIDIGPCRYIDGLPVPGDNYSEVSLDRKVSWGTVQTGVPIRVTLRNDTAAAVNVKMTLRGLRLRA
jgi:hypothetical protein